MFTVLWCARERFYSFFFGFAFYCFCCIFGGGGCRYGLFLLLLFIAVLFGFIWIDIRKQNYVLYMYSEFSLGEYYQTHKQIELNGRFCLFCWGISCLIKLKN